jgi:hypothetical protein
MFDDRLLLGSNRSLEPVQMQHFTYSRLPTTSQLVDQMIGQSHRSIEQKMSKYNKISTTVIALSGHVIV